MSARFLSFSGITTVVFLAVTGMKADAQVSASAVVGAQIVAPVSISQASSQLALSNHLTDYQNAAATINLQGRMQRSSRNGADISAQFEITGSPEYAYSITVPQYISVEHGENVLTLATKYMALSGVKKLTGAGTAVIEVVGSVVTTNLPKRNLFLSYIDEDERYAQNSLPVLISYN